MAIGRGRKKEWEELGMVRRGEIKYGKKKEDWGEWLLKEEKGEEG